MLKINAVICAQVIGVFKKTQPIQRKMWIYACVAELPMGKSDLLLEIAGLKANTRAW